VAAADDRADPRAGEAERLAEGAPNLQRRFGMPIDPAPYPRARLVGARGPRGRRRAAARARVVRGRRAGRRARGGCSRAAGRTLSIRGFNPFEAYDAAVADLDLEVASYVGPTTNRHPLFEGGRRGAELLLQALAGHAVEVRTERRPLELVVRDSTGSAPD